LKGLWINKIYERDAQLTESSDFLNWTSNLSSFEGHWQSYGEFNDEGELHGRGIFVNNGGQVLIGYFNKNNVNSLGPFIQISIHGFFKVGESVLNEDGTRSFIG
jgi:hypothetical protein